IAARVHVHPPRNPAMLARAAASLDHLSGGRVELELMTGDDPEALTAMGAPHHSPAETTEALTEAVDILHTLWDANERGLARYAGKFSRLAGAQRRAPAHEIPLSLATVEPAQLWLAGERADGWSGQFAGCGIEVTESGTEVLAASNRVIDEAAVAAGRDP